MRCLKQGLCILLLAFLVVSPAFCGWDAFRKSSSPSSMESLDSTKEVTEVETVLPQETLYPEAETGSQTISENSENYEDSSANYEGKLVEAKEALAEAEVEIETEATPKKAEKKKEAVEEAKAIVEDLVVSKAALDENYNILADLALEQMKTIKHMERQETFKVGLGLAMGYKYLETIPLGFDLGFLFNETWAVDVIMTYDVHALGGLEQFKHPAAENVGVLVTVKKYF